MHFRNSCTRSTSSCCIRQVPSGASGFRGVNGRIFFLTRKFQLTSLTRSRACGNARIGSTVTGSSGSSSESRVMHISRGLPLISAEHEPHFLPCSSSARQIRGLLGLDLVDHVEDDHALFDGCFVGLEIALPGLAAPDLEFCFHLCFSTSASRAAVRPTTGSRRNCISPPGPFCTTRLNSANSFFLSG
jgi:hypothetical protein